ncbi:MAG: NADH-quinone oxidoreductase subunit C [Candidatus Methanomethylophilaceae archaeon]|jgi:Ni,Fe-hydrogenase III large subunit/Ni,Fe-hydrogenase III component G
MIQHDEVAIDALHDAVAQRVNDGFGVICMYAVEPGDSLRSLQVIMRKGGDVVRLSSDLDGRSYPSLALSMPGLRFYEREISEMSGITSVGLPAFGPQRIMWRYNGAYPLQKEELPKERIFVPMLGNGIQGEGVFEIPVGPVHAGVIEPGHFRFSVAGEPILKVKAHLGFTYRGVERLLETSADKDNTRLVERISGDTAVANSLAYAHAIEGDREVPYRAKLMRVIFAELERIQCHFNDISGIAQDTAFVVPSALGAGIREKVLRLNEEIGGHRYLMGVIIPGGVRKDISDINIEAIDKRVLKMRFDLEELKDMLYSSTTFMDRAETTGKLSHDDALVIRAVGPVARASGVISDIRKDRPYDAYGMLGMKVISSDKCDVLSRLKVRIEEITESASMINQCLNHMEDGPLFEKVSLKEGFSLGIVEAPRGELMHALHVVNGKVWRHKIRDPSFINWNALERALPGNIVPDFPLINKSFNLSYSGNDL